LLHKSMSVFIDDFSTQTNAVNHYAMLRECFVRCRRNRLALNPAKVYLGVQKGVLLGYVVSKAGKEPDPEKVEVILNLEPPTTIKGIQRALGHFGWYRDVMPNYATAAIPLTNLTRKDVKFVWTPECQAGFDALKAKLTTFPCLVAPDWEKPFHVYCDASAVAVGATLCQAHDPGGKDRPIAFASRQLTASERNYSTTDRECLAMVFSAKKFRHYLLMNPVVFFVDHLALRYMVNKPDLSGRVARWVLLLEELDYTVEYKPGRLHRQADHLSRLSETLGTVEIDDELPDANLFSITVVPTWDTYISEFLSTQKLPEHLDANERRKIRVNSRHYAIIANRLYRRGIDGVLRRCVSEPEATKILEACHDGTCGGHFSGRLSALKILRAGYFWPTMFADAHRYATRCDACQRYARNDLHMALPLNPSLPLLPFEKWGIDYVGPVHPTSPRQNAYILLAVDYLTKWVEAKAVKTADKKTTAKFLFEYIFTRFGVPRVLISDRGTHFLNDLIEELTTAYGIDHRKTTPYHPQTNGLAERVNQTIVRILRKTIQDNKRDWDTKLNAALWAYRTTFKVTTKQTPFALVYGVEAILPIEIEIPSLRIAIEDRWPISESIRDRVLMLEGLNETRRLSAQHIEVVQRRKKAAFDKCHKKRTLIPGTMVMLQDGKKLEFPGKFDAIWLGPYWIMEVYPNNTVQLATLDGTYFPTRTNGERCKVYHV
jgi:RNase H-like domain found in reverse transcriptase/Integrase core domain/Integrase zinc binding domain